MFVNADNLTDVRQTDWDPIARPARDVDGRWTVDAWAPLAGRVFNAGHQGLVLMPPQISSDVHALDLLDRTLCLLAR